MKFENSQHVYHYIEVLQPKGEWISFLSELMLLIES